MKGLSAFVTGVLFALGLGISGMTQTHIVKGFLDIFGDWNISLMGVMIGAIIIHAIFFQIIKKRKSPLLDTQFYLPKNSKVDRRLIAGAALFGLGWGWVGICPGPGIVSLASGQLNMIIFVGFMLIGMLAFKFFESRCHRCKK